MDCRFPDNIIGRVPKANSERMVVDYRCLNTHLGAPLPGTPMKDAATNTVNAILAAALSTTAALSLARRLAHYGTTRTCIVGTLASPISCNPPHTTV